MDFPQYRRYSNNSSYFKIVDERNFIELQFVGEKVLQHHIHALQYPEMLRIQEMLDCSLDGIEVVSEAAVEKYLANSQ
jgi:hypothetical protein